MTRLFTVTEAGTKAMQGLISHIAQERNQTIETHGSDSVEAAGLGLILAYFLFVTGEYRKADPLIRNYIYVAEENYGPYSDEVLCGHILLSNNCIWWGRLKESHSVLERVKSVAQRCSLRREPLLQGLYDQARRYQSRNAPGDEQRSFIIFLLALIWCVRYPSGHNYSPWDPEVKVAGYHEIYAQYIQQLQPVFETYGFVEDRWDWLIRHCNHNLHDLVGLISIFLGKGVVHSDGQPPLDAGMRDEFLRSLVQEFPVCKGGTLRDQILAMGGHRVKLGFVCGLCGSRDLRTMFMEPYYPISTLDGIAVDPSNVDLCDLIEREPSEYEGQGHTEGWQFWCDKCGLEPRLEPHDEDEPQEESLARWLLDNCPQEGGLPPTENSRSEG